MQMVTHMHAKVEPIDVNIIDENGNEGESIPRSQN